MNLAFSTRHKGISIWVLTQQMTSIAKPFRENITVLVFFYTPMKEMKMIFKSYTRELTRGEQKGLMDELKSIEYLISSGRHPYSIYLKIS